MAQPRRDLYDVSAELSTMLEAILGGLTPLVPDENHGQLEALTTAVTTAVCAKWDGLRATVNDSRLRKKNVKIARLRDRLRTMKQRVAELEQRGAPAKKKIPAGSLNLGSND
jgi:hypothetical protein